LSYARTPRFKVQGSRFKAASPAHPHFELGTLNLELVLRWW